MGGLSRGGALKEGVRGLPSTLPGAVRCLELRRCLLGDQGGGGAAGPPQEAARPGRLREAKGRALPRLRGLGARGRLAGQSQAGSVAAELPLRG